MHRSLSFMRMNSLTEGAAGAANTPAGGSNMDKSQANSNIRTSVASDIMSENNFGPLSNVR